jgi:uncharacterized protein YjbI with pentapeptide repeats
MRTPFNIIALLVLIISNVSFSQKNPTTWPYGGILDENRKKEWVKKAPLNFNGYAAFGGSWFHSLADFGYAQFYKEANFNAAQFTKVAYFYGAKFDNLAIFSNAKFNDKANFKGVWFDNLAKFGDTQFTKSVIFVGSRFDDKAEFSVAKFYNANFSSAKFDSLAKFRRTQFFVDAIFNDTQFRNRVSFQFAQFHGMSTFWNTKFVKKAHFREVEFHSPTWFANAHFDTIADFEDVKFDGVTQFKNNHFNGLLNLSRAQFKQEVYFNDTDFHGSVCFWEVQFKDDIFFEGCSFKGILNLAGTNFSKGVDFRRAHLDSVETIYIDHNTKFPDGKFRIYWDQFEAKDNLRLKLWNPPKMESELDSINEHYKRIATFYHRLKDNFIAQDDKGAADAVMYELEWQRKKIKKEWKWKLYGWFFGWGYKPWKFLLFIVGPIIILFSIIWCKLFYHLVVQIVWDKAPQDYEHVLNFHPYFVRIGMVRRLRFITFVHSNFSNEVISYWARFWHVLHFSTSVLFGIRFKKEWINTKNNEFLSVIALEWVIGILLYIMFAYLVKGVRFGFIRELIGF